MLHHIEATWTPSSDDYAGLSTEAESTLPAASTHAIAVSSTQAVSLFEHPAKAKLVTASSQAVAAGGPQPVATGLYTADTAVMALAMIGAWMVVVGGAMLSRHLRQIKSQPLQSLQS